LNSKQFGDKKMSKFLVFILGAILGLVIGGLAILYFFGGAPRAEKLPGEPIRPPEAEGTPAATATIALNQQFFDSILGTIFRDMNAPAFPLGSNQNSFQRENWQPSFTAFQQPEGGCDSKITLKPEGSGVTTGVRLENGKIYAPLAFNGSKYLLGNCMQFAGWAQANLNINFDETQQTVFGQIEVETVNLDGISPIVGGIVTPFVQSSLNQRVNPITILRGQQIALNLPIAAAAGTLNARVKDVRSDIKDNALNLYITYDFAGTKTP
jgi:hypothetical protein